MRDTQPDKSKFPRHLARRAVVQAMYEHLIGGESDVDVLLSHAEDADQKLPPGARQFARELLKAALERESLADSIIEQVATNWDLDRISTVDRCILRLGIAEFLDFDTISPKVTIDEAVELAKEFGGVESPKFVNGVLDAALKKLRELNLLPEGKVENK